MDDPPARLPVSVLVVVVPTLWTAAVALALSRARLGPFTSHETVPGPLGYERYRFKSAWHRRAFGTVVLLALLASVLVVVFVADPYLVCA